jgi:tetratricopeptide (TPR) repeat protein
MILHYKHRNRKNGTTPEKSVRRDIETDLLINSEDSALFKRMSEYLKARLDLEDVRNDPALHNIEDIVSDMTSDYHTKRARNKDDEKFIRDNFREVSRENETMEEINNIKLEIDNNNINEISESWIKDWHEKIQRNDTKDSKTEEIRSFIISSLESDKSNNESRITGKGKKLFRRSLIQYISLSAAAIIGVFIVITTLLPSYDPEKLFNSYYEPLNVVLPVTRSLNINESDSYITAIESYKLGDYRSAGIEFSNAMLKDNSAIAPRFFMGITQLAMGNYNQAISLLSDVTNRSGEFGKEARWYLGLAYLKTGDKEKASECFELLAQSPGFYHERADKILRRLK